VPRAHIGRVSAHHGHHNGSESLFYYFRLEDHVPENHLLRLIDTHVDFGFIRDRLSQHYSDTVRPSIDPELLLRILLIGYLYGITSERRLLVLPAKWPKLRLSDRAACGASVYGQSAPF
jgi:Transposase domain (DUF772)